MSDVGEKIIIVGGGIGGLATAIALRQRGCEVHVYEQAPELREIGAGLSIWRNATRVLRVLGLLPEVLDRSAVLERLRLRTSKGKLLSDIKTIADFETPSVCMHRADLLSILKEQIPERYVHLGERLETLESHNGVVSAGFSSQRKVDGQALIGADGLNSTVRAQVLGPSKPIYRGSYASDPIDSYPAFSRTQKMVNSGSKCNSNGTRTAKRLRYTAQGCLNPG